MTPANARTASDFYREAIRKLQAYADVETDETKAQEAEAKIAGYRHAIVDAAFDNMANRTANLTALASELASTSNGASKVTSVQSALTGITGLVTSVQNALNGTT